MKSATNGLVGRRDQVRRRADLDDPAVDEHADRSARAAASWKSCVTSSVGSARRASRSPSSARTRARVCASSAASGSSSEQDRRVAGERPGERDPLALAARELAGAGVREARDPEQLEQVVGPLSPGVGDVLARPSCAGRARTPGRRARPTAARAARRHRRRCPATPRRPRATRPRSGRSSPAIARRTVVFPAPEGPTSASVPRPTSSSSSRRKERSG